MNTLIDVITSSHELYATGKNKFFVFSCLLEKLLEVTDSEYGFIGEILHEDGIPFLRTNAITNIAWNDEMKRYYELGIDNG